MKLKELVKDIPYTLVQGDEETEITGITHDTRDIEKGDLFLCIDGTRFDSHTCLEEIASKGAGAILIEKPISECPSVPPEIPIIQVEDEREVEGPLAARLLGNPADKLITVGVTGSKGKTTVANMILDILNKSGRPAGIIGTNGFILNGELTELTNTTPSAIEIQKFLKEMVDKGAKYAVIECSSQGLMMGRLGGITFDIGVFLNISKGDHIGPNEHKDFDEYLESKGRLIKNSRQGLLYYDDPHTEKLLEHIDTPAVYFGGDENADYIIRGIKKTFEDGTPGQKLFAGGKIEDTFLVNLPGDFNALNALVAIAVCDLLGVEIEEMKKALGSLNIKGRFDIVYKDDDLTVCVDFAHNGLSTRNHLTALREYNPERLVCIFGADGNRSIDRRLEMGEASGRLADFSIVTSGHNRWETFEEIFKDIRRGLEKTDGEYVVIPNRKEAIQYALKNRKKGDFITILGLGHESYQEENGVMYPYSDIQYVKEIVKKLGIDKA